MWRDDSRKVSPSRRCTLRIKIKKLECCLKHARTILWEPSRMQKGLFSPGDAVVYRKCKHSSTPGPRAKSVDPAPRGEEYTYTVDKFWVVVGLLPDDTVRLATRRGKEHVVQCSDPNLRHARWWERLIYRDRFPKPGDAETSKKSVSK